MHRTKPGWIISIHSHVDLITNSSSELFIIPGNKTKQAIKDLIIGLAVECNEQILENKDDVNPYSLIDLSVLFTDIFAEEPTMINNDNQEDISDSFSTYSYYQETRPKSGDLYLRSASDNTVPWLLMEKIDNCIPGVTRIHEG